MTEDISAAVTYFAIGEALGEEGDHVGENFRHLVNWLKENRSRYETMEELIGSWVIAMTFMRETGLRDKALALLLGHRMCDPCASWTAKLNTLERTGHSASYLPSRRHSRILKCVFGFLRKRSHGFAEAESAMRALIDSASARQEFADMLGLAELSVAAVTARKIFLMWLLRLHGQAALEPATFATLGEVFLRVGWSEQELAGTVRLGDWIIAPGELAEVAGRLMDHGIRAEPPPDIMSKEPEDMLDALAALDREQRAPFNLLFPIVLDVRFRAFSDAWQRSGKRGVSDPVIFGLLAADSLHQQVTGEFPPIEQREPVADLDRSATISKEVHAVFEIVKLVKG